MEAASSVGMTRLQAYFRIIFPQAFVVAIPNISGQFIGLLKGTTLAYYTGVVEITGKAYELANSSYMFLEAFFLIAVIYEVLSFIFSKIFRLWENNSYIYKAGIAEK